METVATASNHGLIPLDGEGNPKYTNLQDFKNLIKKNPSESWVKKNPYSQNAKYLPIRIVEELLGEIFPF